MVRSLSLVAALVSLLMFSPGAMAQEKYELTGIIGRTFVSDQGVTGVVTPDTILHSGKGLTFEANIARHLLQGGLVGLSVEVTFAVNFDQDVHFSVNLVPKDYKSFFVTPSIRANVFPSAGLSPWVSAGGGFGYFNENATLEFGGTNPGKTGTSTGVFQIGGGIDVKIFRG